jgi:hypothetical protein
MSTSHFVLLIEKDPALTGTLAAQLVRLGIEPIRVPDMGEAAAMVKSKQYAVSAVLLPSELDGKGVHKALKSMRRREPVLPCMAYGKVPEPGQRKRLRQAGVLLALWDGYDVGILRFQLNRLISGESQPSVRGARRAPIHVPVRVQVGGREKDGVLYSLSEGGCFIETPRASMDGARLRMIFQLEQREFEIDGVVAFANVPGNLQRPNLPLGMGVRFEDVPDSLLKPLGQFIQERMNSLEV